MSGSTPVPSRTLSTVTSRSLTLDHQGWYLPEASHPYNGTSVSLRAPQLNLSSITATHPLPHTVLASKYDIDFASPKGANPPVDPDSITANQADAPWLEDATVKAKLAGAKALADVRAEDYDAIFYVGGLGPVLDLYKDPANIKFASEVRCSNLCSRLLDVCADATDGMVPSSFGRGSLRRRCATGLVHSLGLRTRTGRASTKASGLRASPTTRRSCLGRSR